MFDPHCERFRLAHSRFVILVDISPSTLKREHYPGLHSLVAPAPFGAEFDKCATAERITVPLNVPS